MLVRWWKPRAKCSSAMVGTPLKSKRSTNCLQRLLINRLRFQRTGREIGSPSTGILWMDALENSMGIILARKNTPLARRDHHGLRRKVLMSEKSNDGSAQHKHEKRDGGQARYQGRSREVTRKQFRPRRRREP